MLMDLWWVAGSSNSECGRCEVDVVAQDGHCWIEVKSHRCPFRCQVPFDLTHASAHLLLKQRVRKSAMHERSVRCCGVASEEA